MLSGLNLPVVANRNVANTLSLKPISNNTNNASSELSLRILTQTIPSANPPQVYAEYAAPALRDQDCLFHDNKQALIPPRSHYTSPPNSVPARLAQWLARASEPVNIKVEHWGEYWGASCSAHVSLGAIVARVWTEDYRERYRILPATEGYCLSFSVQSKRILRGRATVTVFLVYRFPRLDLRFNLDAAGYLPVGCPAYIACETGDWKQLRQLLSENKARITDRTGSGETFLHVSHPVLGVIRKYLKVNSPVQQIATRSNNLEIVLALLQEGADPNTSNDFGQTSLHVAVYTPGAYPIAHQLLNNGADLTHQNLNGQTPLHTFFNTTSAQLIRHHQDDVDTTLQDYRGMNITHYISWSKSSRVEDVLPCIKASTAPLDAKDETGRTALHLALQRGNTELIRYFLEHAAPSQQPDHHGRTLLYYAVESRRTEAIDILLERGYADVHAMDFKGRTVLHHAAAKKNFAAVKKLVDAGASLELPASDEIPQVLGVTTKKESRGSCCEKVNADFCSKSRRYVLVSAFIFLFYLGWYGTLGVRSISVAMVN